jgi:diguanylate cyclase (GGDEF)-like protein
MPMGESVNSACHFLRYLDQTHTLLPAQCYTIGRNADIVLPGHLVSPDHAQIAWQDGQFWIVDGEGNGTFINDRRITKEMLRNGDNIRIGGYDLQFIVHDDALVDLSDCAPAPDVNASLEEQLSRVVSGIEDPSIIRKFYALKELYDRTRAELLEAATRDPLTGLYNRRFFQERAEAEVARCRRYQRPLQLAMLDLDHFKRINDTRGHQKGDEVLGVIARVLLNSSRTTDIAVRYGGDELLLLLPETDARQAFRLAEKIRTAIRRETVRQTGIKASVSIGIAGFSTANNTVERLMFLADSMLYTAKAQGRNRTASEGDAPATREGQLKVGATSSELGTGRFSSGLRALASLPALGGQVAMLALVALVSASGMLNDRLDQADSRSAISAQVQALHDEGVRVPSQAFLATSSGGPPAESSEVSALTASTSPSTASKESLHAVNRTVLATQQPSKHISRGAPLADARGPQWRMASGRSVQGQFRQARLSPSQRLRARAIAMFECDLSRTDGTPQGTNTYGSCETVSKHGS